MTEPFRPFYWSTDPDSRVQHALREIKSNFGVVAYVKPKSLVKFGRNLALSTVEQSVWETGGDETYPVANTINTVVSTAVGDDQDIKIEGHTIDGSGNFTFVVQSATLTGTTNVTLTTPLARVTRLYNNDNTDFAGTLTAFESVGGTVHLTVTGANNQSLKCLTTISNLDFWIILGWEASVRRDATQSRRVDFRLQIREKGKVFRTKEVLSVTTEAGTHTSNLPVAVICPANSDFRIRATSSGTGTVVEAVAYGILATTDLNQLDGNFGND